MRMKSKAIVSLSMLIIVFTAACQPTPEKAAVVGDNLQEAIAQTSDSPAHYDVPQTWRETLDIQGTNEKITLDAAVSVPDVTAYPVYEVEKEIFDNQQFQPLVEYFVKGRDVFKETEITKSDIEEAMVLAKKDGDIQWLQDLEGMLEDAPETVELVPITDWTLKNIEENISGYVVLENGIYANINISTQSFCYSDGYTITDYVLALNEEPTVGDVSLSEEDAIQASEKVLDELGIEDMSVTSIEKAVFHSIITHGGFIKFSQDAPLKGYVVTFVHNIDGIPTKIVNGVSWRDGDEFAYTAPFYQEVISTFVNESGEVKAFMWDNPIILTEKLSKNVSLMPFDEMQERIRDMLRFVFEYDSQPVTVDSIDMYMALVNKKDESDAAMYVPAWYIHCIQHYSTPGIDDIHDIEQTIVLNAIDGGRMRVLPTDPVVPE